MQRHEIDAARDLRREALRERAERVKLRGLGRRQKFVGYAHGVFDLHRDDRHGRHRAAAFGLRAVFGDKVDFLVQRKRELLLAVKRNRARADKRRQNGFAFDRVDHFRHDLGRKQRAFGKNIAHKLFSSFEFCQRAPQGRRLRIRFARLGICQRRRGRLLPPDQSEHRLRVRAKRLFRVAVEPVAQLER